MKHIIFFILTILSVYVCKGKDDQQPTLKIKVPDFNFNCQFIDVHYEFTDRKFGVLGLGKDMRIKKGRVMCGRQFFYFTINYYTKDFNLSFIDITYKGKTFRLIEDPTSDKIGGLRNAEFSSYGGSWEISTLLFSEKCYFSYADGSVNCFLEWGKM